MGVIFSSAFDLGKTQFMNYWENKEKEEHHTFTPSLLSLTDVVPCVPRTRRPLRGALRGAVTVFASPVCSAAGRTTASPSLAVGTCPGQCPWSVLGPDTSMAACCP